MRTVDLRNNEHPHPFLAMYLIYQSLIAPSVGYSTLHYINPNYFPILESRGSECAALDKDLTIYNILYSPQVHGFMVCGGLTLFIGANIGLAVTINNLLSVYTNTEYDIVNFATTFNKAVKQLNQLASKTFNLRQSLMFFACAFAIDLLYYLIGTKFLKRFYPNDPYVNANDAIANLSTGAMMLTLAPEALIRSSLYFSHGVYNLAARYVKAPQPARSLENTPKRKITFEV